MSEYINIINMHELSNAIRERNTIERNRLEFERAMFESNKQLNDSSIKSNEDMVEVMRSLINKLDIISKDVKTLFANDIYLKEEIKKLDIAVTNLL